MNNKEQEFFEEYMKWWGFYKNICKREYDFNEKMFAKREELIKKYYHC